VRRVELNYGYAVRYDSRWCIRWQSGVYFLDVCDTVDSPIFGIEAIARQIERYASLSEATANSLLKDAQLIRSGWCSALCKTGMRFTKPTCEEARKHCEDWQGGFVRFITAEELEAEANKYMEIAQKRREDAQKIRSLLEPIPAPPPAVEPQPQPPPPAVPTPVPTPPTPTPAPQPFRPPEEIPEEVKEKIEEVEKAVAKPTLLDAIRENWVLILIAILVLMVLLK
jgi:hypothetical protein